MNGTRSLSNGRVAISCVLFVGIMVGAAYAAVPLYDLFCRVTGFGGTTQIASSEAERIVDREITVRFDANVNRELGWSFRPETVSVKARLGETLIVNYIAENIGTQASVGTSTFNVTPGQAGGYFNKLECFCFTEQALAPGESIKMPVQFYVSPDAVDDEMMDSVNTITLSYTFFEVKNPTTAVILEPFAGELGDG